MDQPQQTQPPSASEMHPTHPHSSGSKPKAPIIMIVGAGIVFVVLLLVGGVVWMGMSAKSNLKSLVQAQVADFEDLEKTYKSVKDTLAEDAPIRQEGSADLLKANPKKISDLESQVLGAEEDLQIHINRKLADNYKKGRSILGEIQTNTTKIAEIYQNPLTKPMLPDATNLIRSTKELAKTSDSLLAYLNEINSIEISSKTLGYQIGLSLQETIARDADKESVAGFKSKVNELDSIFEKFKKIDISEIPEDLQAAHKEDIASFSEDTKVFRDVVTAFEERDLELLSNSIESLILQGASESTAAEIEVRNFWYEDPTINEADDLKNQWQRFGEDELGIIF